MAAGKRLRDIREALGLTRTELAIAIDRSEKTIRAAENGAQALGPKSWVKLDRLHKDSQGGAPKSPMEPKQMPQTSEVSGVADIARIVANPATSEAVKALVATGLTAEAAWEAVIGAHLKAGPR